MKHLSLETWKMAGHHSSPSCCGRVFKLNPSAQDFDKDRRCNSRQTPAHVMTQLIVTWDSKTWRTCAKMINDGTGAGRFWWKLHAGREHSTVLPRVGRRDQENSHLSALWCFIWMRLDVCQVADLFAKSGSSSNQGYWPTPRRGRIREGGVLQVWKVEEIAIGVLNGSDIDFVSISIVFYWFLSSELPTVVPMCLTTLVGILAAEEAAEYLSSLAAIDMQIRCWSRHPMAPRGWIGWIMGSWVFDQRPHGHWWIYGVQRR